MENNSLDLIKKTFHRYLLNSMCVGGCGLGHTLEAKQPKGVGSLLP